MKLTMHAMLCAGSLVCVLCSAPVYARQEWQGITLDQALARALEQHPQLAGARARVEAESARADAAVRAPNPELILGGESIPLDGGGSGEGIAGVGLTLPSSDRRTRARAVHEAGQAALAAGLDVLQRQIEREVRTAFAVALYYTREASIHSLVGEEWERERALVRARVNAGEATVADQSVVERAYADASLKKQTSADHLAASLRELGSVMGESDRTILSVRGRLEDLLPEDALRVARSDPDAVPAVRQAGLAGQAAERRVELARAQRWPDWNMEVLYRQLADDAGGAVDAGIRIPLPIRDTGRDRLRVAQAEQAEAESARKDAYRSAVAEFAAAHAELGSALDRRQRFESEILPSAQRLRAVYEARHDAGDISLLDVLPFRRDALEAELDYLGVLRDVLIAYARLRAVSAETE